MKRQHHLIRPTKVSDFHYDDWMEELSHDWHLKAARLQARRWRMLKNA